MNPITNSIQLLQDCPMTKDGHVPKLADWGIVCTKCSKTWEFIEGKLIATWDKNETAID